VSNISNYNQFPTVIILDDPERNSLFHLDGEGECVEFSDLSLSDTDHIFDRFQTFETTSDRDTYFDLLGQLLTNYLEGIEKIGDYQLKISYLFRKNDLKNAKKETGIDCTSVSSSSVITAAERSRPS
jgi:hypothetical protein